MNLRDFGQRLIPSRRTIWIADAHSGDGKHFIVRADEKLSAFVELESAIQSRQSIKSK